VIRDGDGIYVLRSPTKCSHRSCSDYSRATPTTSRSGRSAKHRNTNRPVSTPPGEPTTTSNGWRTRSERWPRRSEQEGQASKATGASTTPFFKPATTPSSPRLSNNSPTPSSETSAASLPKPDQPAKSLADHHQILDAIKGRDERAAAEECWGASSAPPMSPSYASRLADRRDGAAPARPQLSHYYGLAASGRQAGATATDARALSARSTRQLLTLASKVKTIALETHHVQIAWIVNSSR